MYFPKYYYIYHILIKLKFVKHIFFLSLSLLKHVLKISWFLIIWNIENLLLLFNTFRNVLKGQWERAIELKGYKKCKACLFIIDSKDKIMKFIYVKLYSNPIIMHSIIPGRDNAVMNLFIIVWQNRKIKNHYEVSQSAARPCKINYPHFLRTRIAQWWHEVWHRVWHDCVLHEFENPLQLPAEQLLTLKFVSLDERVNEPRDTFNHRRVLLLLILLSSGRAVALKKNRTSRLWHL